MILNKTTGNKTDQRADDLRTKASSDARILPFFCALRIAQESCLWILPVSVILRLAGQRMNPIPVIAAILIGGLISFLLQRRLSQAGILSYMPLILPVLATGALVRSIPDGILTIPPLILLVLAVRNRFLVDYNEVSPHFVKEAVAILLGGVLGMYQGCGWALPLALICLITLVFLLRITRQVEDQILTPASLALEIALMAILCVVCMIISSPTISSAILSGILLVIRTILTPIVMALSVVFYGMVWAAAKLLSLFGLRRAEGEELSLDFSMGVFTEEEMAANTVNPHAQQIVWAIVVAIIVIVAVRWVIRRFRSHTVKERRFVNGRGETVRSHVDTSGEKSRRVAFSDRSTNAKVRRAYAKFLRDLIRSGHEPKPGDTSLEIQNRLVTGPGREQAKRLRSLYLRARYDTDSTISEAEAAEAAALEKQIKELL